MSKKEIWKNIPGYKGMYQVSNHGNVKSLKRKIIKFKTTVWKEESILSLRNKGDYKMVTLFKNGKRKNYRVNRLVAIVFIENVKNKPFVNHINGIKSDNRVENLEWVTAKENTKHAIETGLIKRRS